MNVDAINSVFLKFPLLRIFFVFIALQNLALASKLELQKIRELPIEERLTYIDEIRLIQPSNARLLLNELESSQGSLTKAQNDYFLLLSASQLMFEGNFSSGLKITKKLLKDNSLNINTKRKTIQLNMNVALINRDWGLGFKHLEQLLLLLPQLTDDIAKQDALVVAAMFYNRLNEHKITLSYVKQAKQLDLNKKNLCVSERLFAEASLKLGVISPHDYSVQNALETCENNQQFIWSGFLRTLIARLYNDMESPNDALNMLLPYLPELRNTKYSNLIAEVYSAMAQAYWLKQNTDKAYEYAQKALEVGNHISSTLPMVQTYLLLYKIEKLGGNVDKALEYHEQYAEADRRYLDDLSAKAMAFQLAQHQAEQQEKNIALLNNQNQLLSNRNALLQAENELALSETENSRLIGLLMLIIMALLAFFGVRSWLSQRRLKVLASTDYLTQTYNRGHFMMLAEEMLASAERTNRTDTCIVFDLDKFKEINDKYGHAAGDWVLRAVADAVKTVIRDQDIFARLGGEEFIILLPNCDTQAALYVTEECGKRLAAIDTRPTGNRFGVSASFGISTTAISGYILDDIVRQTDEAMYLSKQNGRRRVTIHQKPEEAIA
ncbi:diguanylate cyclase [Thalassotalea euphylliae]|uniref:tetratricopeptide repeat-containing diguanylate cyclase n=1 Tax=Thalassotalea euphylliae TaxID=1655234 RepID=UPI00363C77F5